MRIAHDVTQHLDHSATKSPTPASILIIPCHVAFITYTSRDKHPCFSKQNNSIWG
jgi:hypothetical protein